ncbi:MAG TPA: prephenate dehydratase [Opitutaceae bacterium]|jgi:chorismate mutase/prephenate dehydratase|nr:prephenate dehydratase [Opitutaceae bacterium]
MEINSLREKIDRLDTRLVKLLNQRLALAAAIGRLKRSKDGRIYVAEREDRVLRKVCGQNQGPMKDAALRAIYREVMSAAIALEKPLAVAYLGPEATNTHQAAIKKFGASVDYNGMATIGDIFTAVEKGEADYGVIPIENSTEGSVRDALDQFVDSDLKVVAQIYLEIIHALISTSPLEKIEKVYSKDQALAQCRMWLQRHLPHAQVIDSASTSSAVQIAKKTPGTAAVASPIAAEYYGVPVVAANIQDKPDNTTRFFVVGKQASGSAGGGRDMTSFLVSLGDDAAAHPGALLKMLLPLAKRGINLSKIESRPSKKRPWDYFFFIDVTGHYDDPGMHEAVKQLRRFCPLVKWLGSYPVAK